MCSHGQNQKLKINEIKANLFISRDIHCIRNIIKTQIKEIFDAIFCGFEKLIPIIHRLINVYLNHNIGNEFTSFIGAFDSLLDT